MTNEGNGAGTDQEQDQEQEKEKEQGQDIQEPVTGQEKEKDEKPVLGELKDEQGNIQEMKHAILIGKTKDGSFCFAKNPGLKVEHEVLEQELHLFIFEGLIAILESRVIQRLQPMIQSMIIQATKAPVVNNVNPVAPGEKSENGKVIPIDVNKCNGPVTDGEGTPSG